MSETMALLADVTRRVFDQEFDDAAMRRARTGQWPQQSWATVTEQGLPASLVGGEQGFGIPLVEGLALVRLIGRHVVPLPLAETMVANMLLERAGLPLAEGPVAIVPRGSGLTLRAEGDSWSATGTADRVAWGRDVTALLIEGDGRLALMTAGFATQAEGSNIAHMPRDRLAVEGMVETAPWTGVPLIEAGALIRALMMAGALERLVELTVAHTADRVQFGRALSGFQAVQHALARLAGEAAAAAAAADLAARAFAEDDRHAGTAIAAARTRIGDASTSAIAIAHQLHGAIGVTEEHRLHWYTTALWSWRDEFGTTGWWTRRLGVEALGHDQQTYWPFITAV